MAEKQTKFIFVTGGVVSGLGKGITAASLGRLLKCRGLKVASQKLDPYVNVDPGTMSPLQHGEVFVTDDGTETDLDLGHYERFIDENLNKYSNLTTGKVYWNVLNKERAGEYLGQCVQVIPHITNEIKSRMRAQASDDVDVIITEIGGTVGDIESQPFLEAAREVRRDLGPDNCMFVHVSLVPYISAAHELKTKPTQHSVMMLRQLGISPDALVLRSDRPLNQSIKDKISLMCDVDAEGVVNCVDAPSIYDVPKTLFDEGLDAYVVRELGLPFHDVDWDEWADLLERVHHPKHEVNIAIVGKYIDLPDAYLSVTEAIKAGGFANWAKVNVKWVAADKCATEEGAAAALDQVDGIVIPGGFGIRGIDGKIGALKFARETKLPALGLCLGLQSMVIEYSRHVLGIEDANSSEFEPDCANPVIATMEEQKDIVAGKGDMGHTMRLGSYPAELEEGSIVAELYGTTHVTERHRHRYEVNVAYKDLLREGGLRISGMTGDAAPTVETDLGNVQCVRAADGWRAYIPAAYNASSGGHEVNITVNGETITRSIIVLPKDFGTVDVEPEPDASDAANTQFRNAVWGLYETPAREKMWQGGFVNPVESYTTLVDYGQVRVANGRQGSRSNSTKFYTIPGEPCRAPANGVVVLAAELALTGNTVVIDHGCEMRSYLYGLQTLSVSAGQTVEKGQAVGVLGEELTMDFKLGSKSVNPWMLFQTSGGLFWKENS